MARMGPTQEVSCRTNLCRLLRTPPPCPSRACPLPPSPWLPLWEFLTSSRRAAGDVHLPPLPFSLYTFYAELINPS